MPASDREVTSVCPVCFRRLRARRYRSGCEVRLVKECPEHGRFDVLLWRGRLDFDVWAGAEGEGDEPDQPCPESCGPCPSHLRGVCCALLEVTEACDLACPICFAGSAREARGPATSELVAAIRDIAAGSRALLQLSGGEPTTRDDLPELIRQAKAAGLPYVQLNTNGLRLGSEAGYAARLAEAGLSFVFLQFDALDDGMNAALRGRPLLAAKERAIEACASAGLGVTLVPTLVRGVNDGSVGELLRYAVSRSPVVRGIHYQPRAYLGRYPGEPGDEGRVTLDELVAGLEARSGGLLRARDLSPSRCDHPLCGFHGDFVVTHDGALVPLAPARTGGTGCCGGDAAVRNRAFVARRWLRKPSSEALGPGDLRNLGYFQKRVEGHGFTVTAMVFQDLWNLDAERLRRCSLRVYSNRGLVPFCSHYLPGKS